MRLKRIARVSNSPLRSVRRSPMASNPAAPKAKKLAKPGTMAKKKTIATDLPNSSDSDEPESENMRQPCNAAKRPRTVAESASRQASVAAPAAPLAMLAAAASSTVETAVVSSKGTCPWVVRTFLWAHACALPLTIDD